MKHDIESISHQLADKGYVVIENVLSPELVQLARERVESLMAHEREHPYHPTDGIASPQDEEVRAYYKKAYTVDDEELERMVARTRHYRLQNAGTSWPVPINKVSKNFLFLPTMFDYGKSQRVWNLINKAPDLAPLIEHPLVLPAVRNILGADCNLHDFQSTSIGPQTGGGAWHVDAPLGQIAEPLPEFPLTIQNVWLLDDFTEHNGATRVMPYSHKLRKSPPWGSDPLPDEVVLTAPAGSVAMWLSNTWHRSGPNTTDKARRAILCNYNLSWLRTFTDFTSTMKPEVAAGFSNDLRYLLGFAAKAPQTR
ncbi:phytanoyl-CoA dioxygenase family protein [Pusillimonas sp. MFBS29]|uniref:phytanoyl-CoA dioxygenase family protein n=1 Tax=Pusillimonas sp. MFBS29 TaxID=2886690 RepID=UPI001D0FC388|nr:phytanoyl-CoA dioxygenase family protein [Pusillimonas sp. MFBS29]MCC2597159.1 phytanoyl-CoA dioxygenase family protein [Pusillimonas sp. MFBS29]